MAARRADFKVDYRTEKQIAEIAEAWRKAGGTWGQAFFDVHHFMTATLLQRLPREPYTIEFDDTLPRAKPAYVSYEPVVLHTRRDTWALGCNNNCENKFVLLHEAGHMILHDQTAKAFSDDPDDIIAFAEVEYSAEWQANTFADHLLVPTHIVSNYTDVGSLAKACAVTLEVAARRFKAVQRQWWPIRF